VGAQLLRRVQAYVLSHASGADVLRSMFKRFDADGSGAFTPAELARALADVGVAASAAVHN
jgi:Ca2+-binding EF-hand superfamily protein